MLANRLLQAAVRRAGGVRGGARRSLASSSASSSTSHTLSALPRVARVVAAATATYAGLEYTGILGDLSADETSRLLFAWGSDQFGQLGVGTGQDVIAPAEASSATPHGVVDVKAAGLSTGLLTSKGEFFTFGCGMHGRLGHGPSISNVATPRKVRGIPKRIESVSVGENHVAAITVDGELYTAGRQIHGSLGHDNADPARPARVGGALDGKRVVNVACGTKHTLAVTAEGEVYAFGEGRTLALGQGESKASLKEPTLVEDLQGKGIVHVYAGNGFSLARGKDGTLYSWGCNEYGQLGQGITKRYGPVGPVIIDVPVGAVSCGDFHVVAVGADGGPVFSFGCGGDGRTGLGNSENTTFPTEVGSLEGQKVALVAAGGSHSIVVTEDDRIFTWGKGRNGQLGQGDQIASVAAYRTSPVEIASLGKAVSVAAGKDHTCVIVNAEA